MKNTDPKWAFSSAAVLVAVLSLFYAITTAGIGAGPPIEPVQPESLQPQMTELRGRVESRSEVQDQSIQALIRRLTAIELQMETLAGNKTPSSPVVIVPSKPRSAIPESITEIVVTLYTADSSWSCGACVKQQGYLRTPGLVFSYQTVKGPSGGKSPTGLYPCWTIQRGGKVVGTLKGTGKVSTLNQWFRTHTQNAPVSSSQYSQRDLRDWIQANYNSKTRLSADVSPRSNVWNHLCDDRHSFSRAQVDGLPQWEALALHSAVHDGNIGPVRGSAL